MTLLSVVVPVYKVQGYLRECLDSVLTQADGDLELVAVDDCSPDGSGDILAEYAARDARVRVLTLPENVGLGLARNAGLDAATGEYVWFIDSDDWLTDGALPAVCDRLRQDTPDVLIFNHRKVFWDGTVAASFQPAEFADTPYPGSARELSWVLRIPHVAWNKVVRRGCLLDLGLRFDTGWYEDVSFTFPLLAAVERISVLDRVCVNYRQRRVGAITRTVGDRHFEIFRHWERAFDLLDQFGPAVDDLRPAVFARMIWHYLVVMGNDDRVPRRSRRAFFAHATANYARYRPAGGYPPPSGRVDLVKHRLLARGAWGTFAALWAGVRLRRRAAALPGRLARAARGGLRAVAMLRRGPGYVAGRVYYAFAVRLLPVDEKLAVYAAYWYRGYSCNPAAIYERARELAPDLRGVWAVDADRRDRMPAGVPVVVPGTLAYYRALAQARYLVNNVNFPDWVVRRRGTTHLQTHHGTPLKVMGIEQSRYPGGSTMNYPALLRRCDRWTVSVSSNTLSTEVWERAYPCGYETLEYGYPRNDRLVRAGTDEVARARAGVGAAPGDVVALYAPTHRSHAPDYQPPFDADRVAAALGSTGRLLVRSHYFNEDTTTAGGGRVSDVSAHPCVEDLYLAADVLITDYSSAMFDYATLDRPVVIYAPDWEDYRTGRGVTFDLLECPPGAVARSPDELLDVLRTGGWADQRATAARTAFRERFCAWDDGHAAERVVRRVFLGQPVPGRRAGQEASERPFEAVSPASGASVRSAVSAES